MKPSDFAKSLTAAADLLAELKQTSQSATLHELATWFATLSAASVGAVIKKCQKENLATADDADASDAAVGHAISSLRLLATFIKEHGKKPFAKDLDLLAAWLDAHSKTQTSTFLKAADEAFHFAKPRAKKAKAATKEEIERYIQRLDETYGFEPGFDKVFDALKADASVNVTQMKRIAKQFAKAKSKSRSDALNAIWAKHTQIIEAEHHKAARGDRVA